MTDRREFLERSLDDLDDEHDAGDLSDEDHARLRADYERRLATLDAPRPARPPRRATPSSGSPAGRWAAIAFVALVAVAAGVGLASAVGRRGAGDNVTGADLSPDDGEEAAATVTTLPTDLQSCFDLSGSDAFDCYIAFTRANPDDARGFLYFGLFSVNQGLRSDSDELISGGETFLRRAMELDPGMLEARANLAVLLERTGRDAEAAEVLAPLLEVELPDDVAQLVEFVQQNLGDTSASPTTVPP